MGAAAYNDIGVEAIAVGTTPAVGIPAILIALPRSAGRSVGQRRDADASAAAALAVEGALRLARAQTEHQS